MRKTHAFLFVTAMLPWMQLKAEELTLSCAVKTGTWTYFDDASFDERADVVPLKLVASTDTTEYWLTGQVIETRNLLIFDEFVTIAASSSDTRLVNLSVSKREWKPELEIVITEVIAPSMVSITYGTCVR